MAWGKKISMGTYVASELDLKAYRWCIKNKIHIPNWSGGTDEWNVEIKINDRAHLDPKTYSGYDAQTKMYEYYKYYYEKHISQRR